VATANCAAGGFCVLPTPADGGQGTCNAPRQPNQPCRLNSQCVTTAFCDTRVDAGFCVPKVADGADCPPGADNNCLSGYCNDLGFIPDGGLKSTCGRLAAGQPCRSVTDCVATANCSRVPPAPSGTCLAQLALGQPCTFTLADPSGNCVDGAACLGGTCKIANFDQPVGAACANAIGDCIETAYCQVNADAGSATCAPRNAPGSACTYTRFAGDTVCVDGAQCEDTNLCLALQPAGGACLAAYGCSDLLQCTVGADGGSCAPFLATGAACDPNADFCAGNAQNSADGVCGATGCVALVADGAACTTSGDCASVRCRTTDGGFASAANPGTCQAACF
jgi:hypothetical protein